MRKYIGILFCVLASTMYGQINIKVGYSGQYNGLKETNAIFQKYNAAKPNLNTKFSPFHFVQGLDLGLRYMVSDNTGLEVSFSNMFSSDKKAVEIINEVAKSDAWRLSMRSLSVGIENYFNGIGLGVHIGQNKWKYLRTISGISGKQNVFDDSNYSAKINLIFQGQSGRSAFALKPYYNIPLTDLNIAPVDNLLNGGSATATKNENFKSFGLSIVFYNGRQRGK
jgi:hypothetical protein